jgi:hypothetical protein
MGKHYLDNHGVFDAGKSLPRECGECSGHHFHRPTAFPVGFDLDAKDPFEALRLCNLWTLVVAARPAASACLALLTLFRCCCACPVSAGVIAAR